MTTNLFLALMLLLVGGAVAAFFVSTRPAVSALAKKHGTMPPPMIGAISILFGLFVGFSSAEITARGSGLRLAAQREVSAARSILNFTTGIGPRAFAVREATIEYLQVVTTTERDWLSARGAGEAPGTDPAFSLNLITTGFVQQPGTSDVLKAALLNRVDDLTNARTERLTLGRAAGNVPQWLGLAALALVTQMIGTLAVAGQRGGSALFVAGFTATAMVGLVYLGVADGLIGPSRSQEQTAPFAALLSQTPRLSTSGTDTTARMRSSGKVVIGARTDVFPFAATGAGGAITGFSIDLCRSVLEQVRIAAELGPIEVEVVPLSPANRISMIENGTADMECDLTTETAGRDDAVDFLDTIFYGRTELAVPANSPVSGVAGLKGKRLIAVTGSSNIQAANEMNAAGHLGLSIIPAKDTPEGFRMLAAGAADAMVSSDVLLRTLVAQSGHPGDYRTFDSGLGTRKYGIMVRQGNEAFRDAAIKGLHDVMRSGEFTTLYDRWFTSPIPPGNVNLNLPMSGELTRKVADAR